MADQPDRDDIPYSLEPEEPARPASTPPADRPKASLDAPGVLEGFDEDADFERDPELERAVTGKTTGRRPGPATPAAEAEERPELISVSPAETKVWAAAGGLLLLGALIATGLTAEARIIALALVLYSTALHTGTGVVAAYVTSLILEHRLSRPEAVAARMFAAVAAMAFVFNLDIHLVGSTKIEETILGVVAYLAVVLGAFRIWHEKLLLLVGSHFVLWLVVRVGMELSAFAARAAAAS